MQAIIVGATREQVVRLLDAVRATLDQALAAGAYEAEWRIDALILPAEVEWFLQQQRTTGGGTAASGADDGA